MIVGFTGARRGMDAHQQAALVELMREWVALGPVELHHGDCVGADAQAHAVAESTGARVVLHPPDDPKHRAHCQANASRPPKPYLKRNQAIVAVCEVLVAAPSCPERLRSGVWSTVRKARKANKRVIILEPIA